MREQAAGDGVAAAIGSIVERYHVGLARLIDDEQHALVLERLLFLRVVQMVHIDVRQIVE